jgi:hypothetical protein
MENILSLLKIVACVGTIVIGLYSLIFPLKIRSFTGLETPGGRGITEIRAILGAFFVGVGILPLILLVPETFLMLGYTYLFVGVVRLVSMFIDKSVMQSNIVSVVSEFILGAILVL